MIRTKATCDRRGCEEEFKGLGVNGTALPRGWITVVVRGQWTMQKRHICPEHAREVEALLGLEPLKEGSA